tara:strand:- start:3593 stop:4174 length:582 start_codon:yes stop_codon:yes gene_type:complete
MNIVNRLIIIILAFSLTNAQASSYDDAFDVLMKYEGIIYHDNPKDPGGPTKFGWTLKSYRQTVSRNATKETIRSMTKDEARILYKKYWWVKYSASKIKSKKLAIQLFIAQINMGPYRPNRVLQEMVNDICDNNIRMDGILGSNSLKYINRCARLANGYPYYLHLTYKNDPEVSAVWKWAKKGLRHRIFHFVDL